MNSNTFEMENGAIANDSLDLDMEPLIEQIWNDLQGAVNRSTIRQELREVIPAFAGARIKTYVPIFVRRNTVRRLRAGMAGVLLDTKHEPSRTPQAEPAVIAGMTTVIRS